MRIDPENLRRHYGTLSDDELLAIEPGELTEIAQRVYAEVLAERGLADEPLDEQEPHSEEPGGLPGESGEDPNWLAEADCVCTFEVHTATDYGADAARARSALVRARIPCHIVVEPVEVESSERQRSECRVMVPSGVFLHATAILDRDLFNEQQEADWRTHFQALSDQDAAALDPEVFCAGLLDRVARLRQVYTDEMASRGLKPRTRRSS